ncbi:hypothetical protein LSUE1_G004089 [Lachnellula suecica]|uniref:Zn(2)-C6 fungal-type domain-containing protein n=1 Tax=Lachnellula suecica TaxID=602035 RepID=A0A8T9C9N8_9HELO|nr:hypothetical protein LSUE1_G004089 [Lachnellula suecica]
MNGLTGQSSSGRLVPRDGEDNMSMFFDFGSPAQDLRAFKPSTTTQNQDPAPRGGIRVSLACIPCRSRHVKCGAEMPNCSRCQQDDKPCFYAKSRRGMRDRNAPRKKPSQGGKVSPVLGNQFIHGPNAMGYPVTNSSSESYNGPSSDTSGSPSSSSSKPMSSKRLIDLYYNFFYKAHPFVLPRYYFFTRLESDPESLKHLQAVMQYIGSLYAPDISSIEHRDLALNQLDQPNMPPNGFTVQALLLTAIALHCNDEMDRGREILDRATYLALELRMNSREFANMERDPVLAESWRRTYWGLYVSDSTFSAIRRAPSFILNTISADVELPCEECDYLSGVIPRPRTISEYEARDFEDETPIFSSGAYLIDLSRIVGCLLSLEQLPIKQREHAAANADAMLVNWKLHLPREKQGVIDRNEQVDEILFRAHILLQICLIFIHRPLSRLFHSPIEKISRCAPPPSSLDLADRDPRNLWLHTQKTLQAAETAIELLTLPCSILNHSPTAACGITAATLASLSACCYVLTGPEWYHTRDRIRLGLGGLKKFGEVWATSRQAESDTKKIARSVFALPRPGSGSGTPEMGDVFGKMNFADPMEQVVDSSGSVDSLVGMDMGWQDLREVDYLALLEGMGQQGLNGISI